MTHTFYWYGKVLSVNRWHLARAMFNKAKGKWTGRIYENPVFRKYKDSLVFTFKDSVKFQGYVDVTITCCMGKRSDTGNIEKAIGDSLQESGVLEDDKFIRNIHLLRRYHPVSGSKNKFNDSLKIQITSVSIEDCALIESEQNNDLFNLRKP